MSEESATPVTSPIAQTRSAARQWSSITIPVSPYRDADRLQAEVVCAWPAAGGDDECLAAHLAAVVELDDPGGAVEADPGCLASEDEPNTVRLELRPDPRPPTSAGAW